MQRLLYNKSSSVAGHTENSLFTPSLRMDTPIPGVSINPPVMGWVSYSQCFLQLMMTYYVVTPEMGVSLLRGGQCKPFSVCPAADDDLKVTVVN